MKIVKKTINDTLVLSGIAMWLKMLWDGLEILSYGYVTVRKVDSIIAIILMWSLYYNFKKWGKEE